MKEEQYTGLELETIEFGSEDVIVTSSGDGGEGVGEGCTTT